MRLRVYLIYSLVCSSFIQSAKVVLFFLLITGTYILLLLLICGVYNWCALVFQLVNIIIARGALRIFIGIIWTVHAGLLLYFDTFGGSAFLNFAVRWPPWHCHSWTACITTARTRNCCVWRFFYNQNLLRRSSWLGRLSAALYLSGLHSRLLLAHHELHHIILVYELLG